MTWLISRLIDRAPRWSDEERESTRSVLLLVALVLVVVGLFATDPSEIRLVPTAVVVSLLAVVAVVSRVLEHSQIWSRIAGLMLVVLLAALVYATGGHRSHFEDLYLLLLVFTAAFRSTGRFLEIVAATVIGLALPFAYQGWERDGLSDLLVDAPLWFLSAAVVHVLVQQLARAREEQATIQRVKDQFVSITSHELRTPLTAIRGALGLIESGLVDPASDKGRRSLEIATSNSDRLVRLVSDLLDLERLESGRSDLRLSANDVARLVDEALDGVRPLATEAGVELEADVRVDTVVCDHDRIIQTLTNLVGNAVKFSPSGATVRVEVEQTGDDVTFRVVDRGRGIPEDLLETVFERFSQVDVDDARRKGGSGLGLPISRTIVQQHGGRIWAESEVGRGTTFTFTLPRRRAA